MLESRLNLTLASVEIPVCTGCFKGQPILLLFVCTSTVVIGVHRSLFVAALGAKEAEQATRSVC